MKPFSVQDLKNIWPREGNFLDAVNGGRVKRISSAQFRDCNCFEEVSNESFEESMHMVSQVGMHCLAFYISPHISKTYHGIYFNSSGISVVSNFLARKMTNNLEMSSMFSKVGNGREKLLRSAVKAAKILLLRHELGHYAIDYSLTGLLETNKAEYLRFTELTSSNNDSPEESICNANIARQPLKISDRFEDQPIEFKLNLNNFSRDFMHVQPYEYRGYDRFTRNYQKSATTALESITGLRFNLERFTTASRDMAALNIPLYELLL